MSTVTQHSEWLRGVLGLCVLRTLAGGPSYGYAIATALAEAGLGEVKGGTLYPLLARLEKNALVTVEWRAGEGGPGRKYFALTEAGRAELEQGTARWRTFAATVTGHLSPADGAPPPPRTPHTSRSTP
ncbi:PadR family transcriptional regulator [Kocuria flava]|uniref:Transcriptional regulator n=1 Tax=Kocuria flava TaxID=446860 RepID=A0A0U3HTR7_9MICC|nr:PadR family transcriptional regulator [Kocuria flava]ALU38719.1 PadR family transcriptional regulator [Kocuria flava]GEO93764.1 transcriptional regulator [Kocuria flava]